MVLRSILSAVLVGLVAVSAGAQDKKGGKVAAKSKSKLGEATDALMDVVEKAIKARDYRRDPKQGNGRTPFEQLPPRPGLLVGFDLYPGVKDKTTQYLRGVRPVWLLNDAHKFVGKTVGWTAGGVVRVEAKPGYAVAGFKVHTFFGEINGISVVFAKIAPNGLDMSDSYDSKYYGHNDPATAKEVVCNGDPVIGIHGLVADSAKSHDFGLGLIVLGKEGGTDKGLGREKRKR